MVVAKIPVGCSKLQQDAHSQQRSAARRAAGRQVAAPRSQAQSGPEAGGARAGEPKPRSSVRPSASSAPTAAGVESFPVVMLMEEEQQESAPAPGLSAEERAALAKKLGYRQIGAELPSDVTLNNIITSMPKSVFEFNPWKAWGAVATTVVSVTASIGLIAVSPWYLLPLAWAFAGTAWTGMFVIGHDCGHRSFSKNKLLEDIVGTLMFAPLIYPFEPWRIKHNHHHAHTNKLVEDTAWHPMSKQEVESWPKPKAALTQLFLGSPLKLWASVGHWLIYHFDLSLYTKQQRPRVVISLLAVAAFMATAFPLIVANAGWFGLVKFWLAPWLGYHFWMSTFTVVHHTAAHIPFKPADSWNAAQAQLAGTVHCDYPRPVEFLCHDINVHVPHHVSSKIPWYNLRAATDSLRANWGQYMTEGEWNPRMMKNIFTELHLYDEQDNYVPFDHKKEKPFFAFQRKWLPNFMPAHPAGN